MQVSERKKDPAIQTLGDLSQCRGPRAIDPFEASPAETSPRVLIVEEIDQPVGRLSS